MTSQYELNKHFSDFNASRFEGRRSVNIVIDLKPVRRTDDLLREFMDETRAIAVARRFHNELSKFYFKKAVKRGMKAVATINLHREPHWHLHVHAELPNHVDFLRARSFTQLFVLNDPWLKPNKDRICYFAETKTNLGSQLYNNRFGTDTLIVF